MIAISNPIKVLSALLPIASMGISLATKWVEDKELDERIAAKVAEALANR